MPANVPSSPNSHVGGAVISAVNTTAAFGGISKTHVGDTINNYHPSRENGSCSARCMRKRANLTKYAHSWRSYLPGSRPSIGK